MNNKNPSKAELTRQVNSLRVEFSKIYTEHMEANIEMNKLQGCYIKRALRAFATAVINAFDVSKESKAAFIEYYDIKNIENLQSYSWYSAFAVLRRSIRKLKWLSETHYISKKLVDFMSRIKEIDQSMTERNMHKSNFGVYSNLMNLRDIALFVKNEVSPDYSILYSCLETPFLGGWKMKKHDFIQIISIDKGKRYWDGVPVRPFAERFKELPEELDFAAFQEAIFIQRIEHDRDCYLFDLFRDHMMKVMEEHREEHGEPMIDSFAVFEQISGKPLPTFTAHLDEYGDVVSMEQNKPNLKLIVSESRSTS